MERRPRHLLIVGGTGMLRGLCLELALRGHRLTPLARLRSRIDSLIEEAVAAGSSGDSIFPLSLDYCEDDDLVRGIRSATAARGPIESAICWTHSTAPRAPGIIADLIGDDARPTPFFHVIGSAGVEPTGSIGAGPALVLNRGILYRQVTLGFVIEPGGSRWLTNDEISRGVLQAFDTDAPESVVGVTTPWSKHP